MRATRFIPALLLALFIPAFASAQTKSSRFGKAS